MKNNPTMLRIINCYFVLQIGIYENLYIQINKFEDGKIFENWFKIDIKPFKITLLNTIKKWSWMFKEHLIHYVTDRQVTDRFLIWKAATCTSHYCRVFGYKCHCSKPSPCTYCTLWFGISNFNIATSIAINCFYNQQDSGQ